MKTFILLIAIFPAMVQAQANCTRTDVQNGVAWHCDGDTYVFPYGYERNERTREMERLTRELKRLNDQEERPIWDHRPYDPRW